MHSYNTYCQVLSFSAAYICANIYSQVVREGAGIILSVSLIFSITREAAGFELMGAFTGWGLAIFIGGTHTFQDTMRKAHHQNIFGDVGCNIQQQIEV